MRSNLHLFKISPGFSTLARIALKLVAFFAGLILVYLFATIICINLIVQRSGSLENGAYADAKFANFMVDSTCEFASPKELNFRLQALLEALNAGGNIQLSHALEGSAANFESVLLALFRMNRSYYCNVAQKPEKMFKIESAGSCAEVGFLDDTEVVVVSNSTFKFLKDGVYMSLELRKLFETRR